eukprot:1602045-Pyramimonas_sp.AAC.1
MPRQRSLSRRRDTQHLGCLRKAGHSQQHLDLVSSGKETNPEMDWEGRWSARFQGSVSACIKRLQLGCSGGSEIVPSWSNLHESSSVP